MWLEVGPQLCFNFFLNLRETTCAVFYMFERLNLIVCGPPNMTCAAAIAARAAHHVTLLYDRQEFPQIQPLNYFHRVEIARLKTTAKNL